MNIKYHRINESELSSLPFNEGSMYFCKDTGKLYADPIGGGVHTLINDNIDDNEISNTSTWSSNKISEEINNTKSELHLEMQTVSPVNLLDNSDFTNPVNQKGQNNYSSKPEYCIDRWYTPNSNFVVSIINSGVKLSSVSSNSCIFHTKN